VRINNPILTILTCLVLSAVLILTNHLWDTQVATANGISSTIVQEGRFNPIQEEEDDEHEDDEHEDDEHEDDEHEDDEHEDDEHEDDEHEDDEHEDGEHEDGEHEDGEHEDGEHEDGEHEDGEHEDGEHEDGEHEDDEHEDEDEGHRENEHGEIEATLGQLEVIRQLAEIAENDTATAAYALMQMEEVIDDEEEAIEVLNHLLDSNTTKSVKNLIKMKLAEIYLWSDQREEATELLMSLIKN
jgi:hypothetical protein